MPEPEPSDRRLLVLGAGGHAKVVLEILREGGFEVIGLLDNDPSPRTVSGVAVIGDDSRLPELRASGVTQVFIALGDNALRMTLGRKAQALGYSLVNAISSGARLSTTARVGKGVAIMAGAVVNAEADIEDLAIVNTGAVIDHDVRVGEAAHVGPGCAVAGEVSLGERVFLGVGVSVIPRVVIGADVVVGAGACVVGDLPPAVMAMGVPARVVRQLNQGSAS